MRLKISLKLIRSPELYSPELYLRKTAIMRGVTLLSHVAVNSLSTFNSQTNILPNVFKINYKSVIYLPSLVFIEMSGHLVNYQLTE